MLVVVTKTPLQVTIEISLGRSLSMTDYVLLVSGFKTTVSTSKLEWCRRGVRLVGVALALKSVVQRVLGGWNVRWALEELHGKTS